jgi:AtzE family amidohydrolase
MIGEHASALEIAAAVRSGESSAEAVVEAALSRIEQRDGRYNAFTTVTAERARFQAARIDAGRARGEDVGPLAGVPYAVKNLFDVAGLTTLAGSRIDADKPPATADATAIRRLQQAGAVLVGALNMAEYAMGSTTENAHYGAVHNPHDVTRSAGGSSGGSAAAVAGGLVPAALGTDSNASIRLPSSLCGIFGLKPTFGRLSRHGARPFVSSFDHVGPMARTVADLAAFYDAMQGPDELDPACASTAREPSLPRLKDDIGQLRIAVAGGYFAPSGAEDALAAVDKVATALKARKRVELPETERARAAARLITFAEGGNLHLRNLKARARDFDPSTRDHLLAGALLPAAWVIQAQRFRRWYHARVLDLFRDVDVILAPACPCVAPPLGKEQHMRINGVDLTARRHMMMFTQPLSLIGVPVVAVPVDAPGRLPIGVQIVTAPWREISALQVAHRLELEGVALARVAAP